MPRALLLSPDEQAVSAITGVLEEMAVSCERPLDGASAAQMLNAHNFDLVLVDCENLPAAKLIFDVCQRGKAGSSPVPIAIVDGRAGLPTAFRLGAQLILTKPVSKDHARSTIRTAVSRVRKEEPATGSSSVDVSDSKATVDATEQAAAAAATALSAPAIMTPPATAAPESNLVSALESASTPQMSETHTEAPAPPLRPAAPIASPRVSKRPFEALPGLKPEPEPRLSVDPVLAELDKSVAETAKGQSEKVALRTPVLASFDRPHPKKSGGPVLLLFLMLAGGGCYAAWMYVPGFRALVGPQVERVMSLVGQRTSAGKQQSKSPAPAPEPAEAASQQPATPVNPAPVSNTSAPAAPAAAAAGTSSAPAKAPKPVPAPVATTKNETTPTQLDTAKAGTGVTLDNPPEMDKNVLILSSKGAEKRLAHKVAPVYPKEAKAAGLEGTVVLKALVSDTGKVTSASLVQGDPGLGAAATRAVKQWNYRPYVRNGKTIPFQTLVILEFSRQ